jgi:hypothetical protein
VTFSEPFRHDKHNGRPLEDAVGSNAQRDGSDAQVVATLYPQLFVEKIMDVMIIATKDCTHRHNLEKELECLGILHHVYFVEDHADLVEKYAIRHSPNLIVDGEVVFRSQPTEAELHAFFNAKASARLGVTPTSETSIAADPASMEGKS